MATKNNPGDYDCYANAEPDEPMFVLLARDELAPTLVRIWAMMRDGASKQMLIDRIEVGMGIARAKPPMNTAKFSEAMTCAHNMEAWRKSSL